MPVLPGRHTARRICCPVASRGFARLPLRACYAADVPRRRLPTLERTLERRFVLLVGAAAAAGACTGATQDTDAGDAELPDVDPAFDASEDSSTDIDVRGDVRADARRDARIDGQGGDVLTCPGHPTMIGPISLFRAGTWVRDSSQRVIVGHDAAGLFVYSAICTHLGCTIGSPTATGQTTCPCHSSIFDGNGGRVSGPASSSLVHYQAAICMGVLFIDRTRIVAATTRTTVP